MLTLLPLPRSLGACLLTLCLCGLTACADDAPNEEVVEEVAAEAPDAAPADEADGAVRLTVAQQEPYGEYVADADGRALYLFTTDTRGESSSCYDACAEAWPPLLALGTPSAAAPALDASMLGTIERRDGSAQVTYNGWPLYYYQQDRGAGQVTGQDVHSFGGEWYLVSPEGTEVHAEGGEEGGGS